MKMPALLHYTRGLEPTKKYFQIRGRTN